MNLQQLRTLRETIRCNFNVTEVGNTTFTSQSGVSKQLRDLEDEIGGSLFERRGKRLLGLTQLGEHVIKIADRLLLEADNIKQVASQFTSSDRGTLEIATTHTQVRYRLPDVIVKFKSLFPDVRLVIHQAYTNAIPTLLSQGRADIGIATDAFSARADLLTFPFYSWEHIVLAPDGHPLLGRSNVTLQELAEYPLITYGDGLTGRRRIDEAFHASGVTPDITMTALDADVIKAYVQLGLGVGIVAPMAFSAVENAGLHTVDLKPVFPRSTTSIALRRGRLHRSYVYRFIELCAPHLKPSIVQEAEAHATPEPSDEPALQNA